MDNCILSVIVPIYNSEKYLDQCISSICNQTYENLQIILVNDGSTDHSLEICLEYQERDPRIKVVSQENKGLMEARKYGIESSTGEVIGFVDSDDWIESDMYSQLIEEFQKSNADMISSGIILDYEDYPSKTIYDYYEEGYYQNLDRDIYPTLLHDKRVQGFGLKCNLVNKLFKKHLLYQVYKNINTQVFYGEDCLALYPYCLMAKSIYIMKKAFYHYNIRTNSMCYMKDERLLYNSYLLYSELKKHFYKYKEPYVLMEQLKKYILKIEAHTLERLYDINTKVLGRWHFDFDECVIDSLFVIYGAGGCGQAFYQYVRSKGMEKQVIAWVDKNFLEKSEQCLYPIQSPAILQELKFDHIIIAVLEKELAQKICKELAETYKIERKKIIWNQPQYTAIYA